MNLIRGMHNLVRRRGKPGWGERCVLTIGNFDGVHAGHRVILEQVTAKARQAGLRSRVMIFEPQPLEYFAGDRAPARLTTFQEKVRLLSDCAIDETICLAFNEALRSMPADAFIEDLLVGQLGVRHLIVGDDFRFGMQQQGDFNLLQAAGETSGFSVDATKTVITDGQRVSSTRVRAALEASDFELAERLLTRPYSIWGRVFSGDRLGRQLGFPTANISLRGKVTPLHGVYAVEIKGLTMDGSLLQGVANVGVRPTVGGEVPLLEAHIFDFDEDIYGRKIRVIFRHRIRAEVKFDGLDALKAQIQLDLEAARQHFCLNDY